MVMRLSLATLFIALLAATCMAAESASHHRRPEQSQTHEYWIDPSTGLMWAGKDNGKDVKWAQAMKYCRDLRLAGYADWRLATIDELQGIYDSNAKAIGLAGRHDDEPFTFHIKGNLFLTGEQWSSTRQPDDRGHPSGYGWYFNFNEGRRIKDQLGYSYNKHALCVRPSGGTE